LNNDLPLDHPDHRKRGVVDGKKIRVFKLTTGDVIICSILMFDSPQWQINWGQSATNDTNDGGIYMITCEWPALIKPKKGGHPLERITKFEHYMEGLHQDHRSFLLKEEHIMHIMNPPLNLAREYVDWIKTQW
jgi:hypothetical protein